MSTLTINTDELSIESLTEILKILKRERGANKQQPTNCVRKFFLSKF